MNWKDIPYIPFFIPDGWQIIKNEVVHFDKIKIKDFIGSDLDPFFELDFETNPTIFTATYFNQDKKGATVYGEAVGKFVEHKGFDSYYACLSIPLKKGKEKTIKVSHKEIINLSKGLSDMMLAWNYGDIKEN